MTQPTMSFADALNHCSCSMPIVRYRNDSQWIQVFAPSKIAAQKRWVIQRGIVGNFLPTRRIQLDTRSAVERTLACEGVNLQNGWRV